MTEREKSGLHPTCIRSTVHADMSKYQAFRRSSVRIETAIQATVDDVASKCIANDIISAALRPKFVNGSGDKAQKAHQLVSAVIDQIKVDESKFDDFVEILEQDASFKRLVHILRCEVSKTQQPGHSAIDGPERDNEDMDQLQHFNPPTRSSAEDDQEEPFSTAVEHADKQAQLAPAHSQTVKSFESKDLKVDRKAPDLKCNERFMER